jgi:hypothetical protein
LESKLSDLQTNQGDAWAAVNKYKKGSEEYAKKALEIIKELNKQAQKGYDNALNSKSVAEYDQKIVEAEKKVGDGDKADFTEIYKPIGRKVVEVRIKSGGATAKEEELIALITLRRIEAETDKSKLEKAKKDIEKFKSAQSGEEQKA